jgi:nucleotide-binding universal stress UspA family protein
MSEEPILLCFDGSDDAANAIATAGRQLRERAAVVVTVREATATWELYDPVTILDAGLARLGSKTLGLDEVADEIAREHLQRGVELARAAGFAPRGEVVSGKPWRAICDAGRRCNAAAIVLGAHGRSHLAAELLGSVSAAVSAHAGRPVFVVHPLRDTAT